MAGTSRRLAPEEVGARLRAQFGDDITDFSDQHGHAVATVAVRRYRELITFLRDEPELACDYCDFTGGVDWGQESGFEVITHLFSTTHHHNIRVKVKLPHENPVCLTVSDLFPTTVDASSLAPRARHTRRPGTWTSALIPGPTRRLCCDARALFIEESNMQTTRRPASRR